jgi:tetratricopeptide (TPR) repeat protein
MNRTFACLLAFLISTTAAAQYGDVSFANTGSADAQPAFLRGLALLHDFEYPAAAGAFREAQKIDPDFVMAYWGEAMTYTHPVWYQQDADAAGAVLQRLGATKTKSDREQAYLETVRILYGEGSKDERDNKYAERMAALHQKYPDDVDATAFYALSLLGTSHNGRDTATYMRAAALLEDVFPTHQHHPGVLHYLIHSYDDPIHAPLGMRAARLYGAVAPEAGHALHMTSHIFIAMGMWDDVIDANVRATDVVNRQRVAKGLPASNCGHAHTWLHYAVLQKHRLEEAKKMLDACRLDAFNPDFKGGGGFNTEEGRMNAYADMVASQAMSGFGVEAGFSAPPPKFADAQFTLAYADAYDAYRRVDASALRDAAARLRASQKAKQENTQAAHSDMMWMNMNPQAAQRRAVIIQEVEGMELAVAGKREDAVAAFRKAAAAEQSMPFDFGPPFIEKPALELLGDQLLAMKRNDEAAIEYRAALARTPGRAAVVEGLRASTK